MRGRGTGWQLIVSGGFDPKTGKLVEHAKTVRGAKREASAELVVQLHHGEAADRRASFGELLDA